jgi:hypothetical protein
LKLVFAESKARDLKPPCGDGGGPNGADGECDRQRAPMPSLGPCRHTVCSDRQAEFESAAAPPKFTGGASNTLCSFSRIVPERGRLLLLADD